jgi:Lon protease-like protein
MSKPVDPADALVTFTGRAPIFPLPNVVHFPHLLLPLHIFEPRYRRMVHDCLAGDRLLAMALLKPGWDASAALSRPAVFDMACLGRITAEQRLPDGRYYLVLQGLSRARIVEEVDPDQPYRIAKLELCPDVYPAPPAVDREARREEMLDAFSRLHPDINLERVFRDAIEASVAMGVICDVLTDALKLPPIAAQEVLQAVDVDERSAIVLGRIQEKLRHLNGQLRRVFPPQFSMN